MLFLALSAILLGSAAVRGAPTRAAVTVSVPVSAPGAAYTLARSLVSISIEGDRWPEWAGSTSSKNSFFYNVLNNLGQITGRPTDVRVGANSEDKTTVDESVNVISTVFPDWSSTTPYPEASSIKVSSAYYQLSKWMPAGTHMIWGVNFGRNSVSTAVAQTNSIMAAFRSSAVTSAGIVLDAIEIGNEADLYKNNGLRASSYNIDTYYGEWLNFANNVAGAAGMTQGGTPTLLLASFAGSDAGGGGFSPQGLYSRGVLSSSVGQYINTVSQHHYSGSFCSGSSGLLGDLMNKVGIRGNVSEFDSDIQASISRGLTYIFGETNSYSCHGAPSVSNTAGAAIWTIDYALQAATHGVRVLYFHDGIGFKYNLIQPVTLTRSTLDGHTLDPPLAPHVQPQYYSAIIVNHFIGLNHDSSGAAIATRITELSVGDSRTAGYAAYDNNVLQRILILNSRAYFASSGTARGSVSLALSFSGGSKSGTMRIRRLAISSADIGKGLTYAGLSYENSGNGLVSGTETWSDVSVTSTFTVSDTEAILIQFL